jgi:hypothetical protein
MWNSLYPLPRPPPSLYKQILYLPYEEKEDYSLCLAEQGCKTTEVTKPLHKYGHVWLWVAEEGRLGLQSVVYIIYTYVPYVHCTCYTCGVWLVQREAKGQRVGPDRRLALLR